MGVQMQRDQASPFDEVDSEEARLALCGRVLRCSEEEGNPEDCPLHELRQLPVAERMVWLESRTDEDVEAIFRYHLQCSINKRSQGRVVNP